MAAKNRIRDNSNAQSPALPGQPLRLSEFKKWIKEAENAPSISLNEAKRQWAMTKEAIIMKERESYLAGEGKSYTWDEVKNMAINNKRPQ